MPMSWVSHGHGIWRHRPWWKVLVNTVLRFFQTRQRPARLLVLTTRCQADSALLIDEDADDSPPKILGYGFGRVLHL